MVAKGHDFPEVTLSAILDADATLRFPDFRASERTFAMVAQLAGRSGRGEAGGEVIVQTLAPAAPSIAHAAGHDSAGFLAGEIERRRGAALPAVHPPRRGSCCAPSPSPRLAAASASLAAALGDAPARATPTCSARRRCSASAAGTGAASWSRPTTARRLVGAVRDAVERLAADRALIRDVAIAVDVDPQ